MLFIPGVKMKDPGIEIQGTKNVIPVQAGIHKAKQEYLAKKNGFPFSRQ